jgi:hypothetical protein
MITYRISTEFRMADPMNILTLVFPAFNGEPAECSEVAITVTFDTPQTPADRGPLVKVEVIPNPSAE